MSIQLGVVMDALPSIHFHKDSTLAMLFEAQKRGWPIYCFEQQHLFLKDGLPYGRALPLQVINDEAKWYHTGEPVIMPLSQLDILLMRKDPPFNEAYIYTTYLLEHAERLGVLVANRPQALRDANEKLFTTLFPHCMPTTLVTAELTQCRAFLDAHQDIVCKPLNSMGGHSVFRVKADDQNANVIFETLTNGGQIYMMAQVFLPAITAGDKRILMINGEAVPHALARIPQGNDWRGNLAAGAKGVVQSLTDRDRWICEQVGPTLRERGLYFVGLDVIGDFLTEINVTSPTGIREIDAATGLSVGGLLLDHLIKMKS